MVNFSPSIFFRSSFNPKTLFIRNPQIYTKKVRDTWLLLEKDRLHYRELNDVAGAIWEILTVPQNLTQITQKLTKAYNTSEEILKNDVTAFIQEYVKLGFIQKV